MCPRIPSLCLGIFSTQRAEKTLFIERECLASVGSFVLLLIHCLAHMVAEDFHQDSSPAFQRSFYKVHRALCFSFSVTKTPLPRIIKAISFATFQIY